MIPEKTDDPLALVRDQVGAQERMTRVIRFFIISSRLLFCF